MSDYVKLSKDLLLLVCFYQLFWCFLVFTRVSWNCLVVSHQLRYYVVCAVWKSRARISHVNQKCCKTVKKLLNYVLNIDNAFEGVIWEIAKKTSVSVVFSSRGVCVCVFYREMCVLNLCRVLTGNLLVFASFFSFRKFSTSSQQVRFHFLRMFVLLSEWGRLAVVKNED